MSTGKIVQVMGAVVDCEFPVGSLPQLMNALRIDQAADKNLGTPETHLTLEVALHLGENRVRTVAMSSTDGLMRGMQVNDTGKPISMPVGKEVLGRIMNVIGEPVDEMGPITTKDTLPIHRPAPQLEELDPTKQLFETGIKVIDLLAPYTKGGKTGLFAGVGERTREGNDLWAEMKESGTISKTALVYGQMNEPPGARLRVGLSALTVAEYFRDTMGQDVLLFVDNIFRFTQAGSEVSALLGRMPSAVGYQPTLGTEMGALQERITSTKKGSITSVQAIYVPADDLTDPA